MNPQWKLVEEYAALKEIKGQVRRLPFYFLFSVCVCEFCCGLIFIKIQMHICVFSKNQGGNCRHPRSEARDESPMMRKLVNSECKKTRNFFRIDSGGLEP